MFRKPPRPLLSRDWRVDSSPFCRRDGEHHAVYEASPESIFPPETDAEVALWIVCIIKIIIKIIIMMNELAGWRVMITLFYFYLFYFYGENKKKKKEESPLFPPLCCLRCPTPWLCIMTRWYCHGVLTISFLLCVLQALVRVMTDDILSQGDRAFINGELSVSEAPR